MEGPPNTLSPIGSLVLVTNGTQPVQLQVIKQLLERGCRVRATSDSKETGYWLDNQFCVEKRSGRFEYFKLDPGSGPGDKQQLYQQAVAGVDAIVHSPTIGDLDQPVKEVWAAAAESVVKMLEAANAEKSVHAFSYASSIVAVTPLVSEDQRLVTENSWNAKDPILALSGQNEHHLVHSSSVTYAEQALWQWARTNSPKFKINSICPSNLIGQNFAAERTTDWKNWIFELYQDGKAQEVIPGAGPTQARKSLC